MYNSMCERSYTVRYEWNNFGDKFQNKIHGFREPRYVPGAWLPQSVGVTRPGRLQYPHL